LDKFGFPELAVANLTLLGLANYGESREDLEKSWEKWIHHIPFDAPVSEALAKLYYQRLKKLNPEKNAAAYQRLKRKLDLAQHRVDRYNIDRFNRTEDSLGAFSSLQVKE
jgi:NADH:ubiquinone oxidoreductase subunit